MAELKTYTAKEWILSRITAGKRGYCSSQAIFGGRRPDYLTEHELSAELKRAREAGELRYTDGKWWRS